MDYEKMWVELKRFIMPGIKVNATAGMIFNEMNNLELEFKLKSQNTRSREYSTAENPYKNAPKAADTDDESTQI